MDATVETALIVGVAWMAFKGLLTVLLLLGAGPILRRTPLSPLVVRMEAHAPFARLRSHLPWLRSSDPDPRTYPDEQPSERAR
jgi:hypothetical protein